MFLPLPPTNVSSASTGTGHRLRAGAGERFPDAVRQVPRSPLRHVRSRCSFMDDTPLRLVLIR